MFSRQTVLVIVIIIILAINITVLFFSSRHPTTSYGTERISISVTAPFQEAVTEVVRQIKTIWRNYFFLVSISEENARLRDALSRAMKKNNRCNELERSNLRLRNLLNFKEKISNEILAAEVIGKDPSPWFRSIVIDKGAADGLRQALPVVVPEGIVGLVTEVAPHYAKVLLVTDPNSAIDALVQRTRARGIIKGESHGICSFDYVLRRHDVEIGDTVISSGLDGVFPKGLRIGQVSDLVRGKAGIFQEIEVTPFIDFETLEEVLVILDGPTYPLTDEQ